MRHAALSILLVSLAAAPAAAQSTFDHDFRVAANFAMGVGGELDGYSTTRIGGGSPTDAHSDANLDPSFGFDLRAEGDVLDWLSLGGWFEFLGVLVDAFVVRMTLVPAVLALLGRSAWWLPAGVDRRLPNLDVEGARLQVERPAPAVR